MEYHRLNNIQDLVRRLDSDFNADQQQEAAEYAVFSFTALKFGEWIASGHRFLVGQISYRTFQQLQGECEL